MKDVAKFFGNMFKRLYGSNIQCVAPFPYAPFERKSEQFTRSFLTMNMCKEGCFTLAIKFSI